ncbi:MAG: transposase, partial [Sulfobacillus thermotolerans]|nr:transposase [Sulfobacillus thermotolerans]
MAIIPQPHLFGWQDLQELGDLERLQCVLESLPDEPLMVQLEHDRGRGRNTYPVRAMWNAILAGIVFQHPSIETLRRELARNGQLRELCGLAGRAPSAWAFSRFVHRLLAHLEAFDAIFDELVDQLRTLLPDFGQRLAMDSKALPSFATHRSTQEHSDGRRDLDADYGIKSYRSTHTDGRAWETITRWFGYKIHLLVDATYELPVAWTLTKASTSDITEAPQLLTQLKTRHPLVLQSARWLTADRGYDSTAWLTACWDDYHIKPVIDIRNMWKEGDATRLVPGQTNVTYDYRGTVYCHDPVEGVTRSMSNGGFEQDRQTLKKRCPAQAAGISCAGQAHCPVAAGLRIPLHTDRRVFTPVDRASYQWHREYKHRTAVERVNSRLDVSFGFELHTIRGFQKMRMRS